MLDFGWPELLLIIAVAVIIIGPREATRLALFAFKKSGAMGNA